MAEPKEIELKAEAARLFQENAMLRTQLSESQRMIYDAGINHGRALTAIDALRGRVLELEKELKGKKGKR